MDAGFTMLQFQSLIYTLGSQSYIYLPTWKSIVDILTHMEVNLIYTYQHGSLSLIYLQTWKSIVDILTHIEVNL